MQARTICARGQKVDEQVSTLRARGSHAQHGEGGLGQQLLSTGDDVDDNELRHFFGEHGHTLIDRTSASLLAKKSEYHIPSSPTEVRDTHQHYPRVLLKGVMTQVKGVMTQE